MSDLSSIEIVCSRCNAAAVFPDDAPNFAEWLKTVIGETVCPGCVTEADRAEGAANVAIVVLLELAQYEVISSLAESLRTTGGISDELAAWAATTAAGLLKLIVSVASVPATPAPILVDLARVGICAAHIAGAGGLVVDIEAAVAAYDARTDEAGAE